MSTMDELLAEVNLFRHLDPEFLKLLSGCASQAQFQAGGYVFREGDDSNMFYVLRAGRVSVEIDVPGSGPMIIETLEEGDLLGWSWLVPPLRKQFDARAVVVARALAFDGECVRRKCDENPKLGYELVKLVAGVIGQRLSSTRLQLMDLYASNG